MCMFGGAPSMPAPELPPTPAPAPTQIDPAVLAARQNARMRAAMAGRGGTVASTPGGDLSSVDTAKKSLLGA